MKLSLILFSPAKGGVRENLLSGGITSVGVVQISQAHFVCLKKWEFAGFKRGMSPLWA
jgi:hypothetical protein